MRKGVFAVVIIGLFIFGVLAIYSLKNITGFAIYGTQAIDSEQLNELKLKAGVECLQNSQCFGGFECVSNRCVDMGGIDFCQDVALFTPARKIGIENPINSIKGILTKVQLPYLLSDGEIVEVVDANLTEYFYNSMISVGKNNVEKENKDYVIRGDGEALFTYRLTFSRDIDFSGKNIQGQALRILGKEYIIGDNSDNSRIYLISDNGKFKLEDKEGVKKGFFPSSVKGTFVNLIKDNDGKIIVIEISFNEPNKKDIKLKDNYTEGVFDSIKLSFNGVENERFADVRIGGVC